MPASTSTPAMSWSSASSRWYGARSAPRCLPASVASARWSSCRQATVTRCWSPAPTASAPSCAWPLTPAATTPSASTWWRCAPTMSWYRGRSRCSFSTTTPPGSCACRWPRPCCAASSKGACRPERRSSVGKPLRCPACTRARTTTSRDSASAWSRRTRSSTARAPPPAMPSSVSPPPDRIPTVTRSSANCCQWPAPLPRRCSTAARCSGLRRARVRI